LFSIAGRARGLKWFDELFSAWAGRAGKKRSATLVVADEVFVESRRHRPSEEDAVMKCNGESEMSMIWPILIAAIFVWVAYAVASSKRQARKIRAEREARLPFLEDAPSAGPRYDLQLSDGRVFAGVRLLGTTEAQPGGSALGDWGPMLVFEQTSGKKTYVRPSAVRCIQEA
jgi:hypothetical protein